MLSRYKQSHTHRVGDHRLESNYQRGSPTWSRIPTPRSCSPAWGSGIGRRSPWRLWCWRPVGLVPRCSTGLEETETQLQEGAHRFSCALGPRAKKEPHKNLGSTYRWILEVLLKKKGAAHLEAEVHRIVISMSPLEADILEKSGPTPQGWEAQAKQQTGWEHIPTRQLTGCQSPPQNTASNHTQGQSHNNQRDKTQPHLPVGRHLSLPSDSLQQAPYQLHPQGGQTSEARETITLEPEKKRPHRIYTKWKDRDALSLAEHGIHCIRRQNAEFQSNHEQPSQKPTPQNNRPARFYNFKVMKDNIKSRDHNDERRLRKVSD